MILPDCTSFSSHSLAKVAALNGVLLLIFMTVFFLVAYLRRRLDTVDVAWGLGFTLIAWADAVRYPANRSVVIAMLVTIWGLRLAQHIYSRAKVKGEDPRYTEMTNKWRGNVWRTAYFKIFLLQGVLIGLISLPIATATSNKLNGWGWLTVLGAVIWIIGFCIEAIADRQLGKYIRQQKRPKVLQTGLWRYSRHPNYFGEITQWWGIGVIALQTSFGWIGLVGPLLLTVLIVFVSGIPPIEKRRAKDAAYRKYQRQTSALIPLPTRKS